MVRSRPVLAQLRRDGQQEPCSWLGQDGPNLPYIGDVQWKTLV